MVDMRKACKILVGKPEKRAHLDNLGTGGRILKWLYREPIGWRRTN
jgi:hypothetical protein